MEKIIYSGDQDELLEKCAQLITFVEDAGHIKSAASDAFSEKMMKEHAPDKDHFMLHVIAMGDSDFFSYNRNGDWWPKQELIDRHHTFVKNGHFFREHRNRDPKKAIGSIKASAHNDPMSRVELIVWGDKRKAEKEYENAKAGRAVDVSMSARVKHDICSCCGNIAQSSRNYCEHLKNSMTQYLPKFKKFAYAFNVRPTFFDISSVEDRADRIARHLGFQFPNGDELEKAASADSGFVFSDDQATAAGILLPQTNDYMTMSPAKMAWVKKMAEQEAYLKQCFDNPSAVVQDQKFFFAKQASAYSVLPDALTDEQLKSIRQIDPSILLRKLAKAAAVMPFLHFYAYATKQSIKEAMANPIYQCARAKYLPEIFTRLLTEPVDPQVENMFDAGTSLKEASTYCPDETNRVIREMGDNFSVDRPSIKHRIMRGVAEITDQEKQAAVTLAPELEGKAKTLAVAYGMYKVSFCEAVSELRGQDFIDEPLTLLLTSQNRI